ncbi:MAG: hypothetical protein EXS00_05865 [Phycisphaerales bacterium]|nr:hypothetical protein [Phycisphaerales bacterium]
MQRHLGWKLLVMAAAVLSPMLEGCRGAHPSPGFSKSLVTGMQTMFLGYRNEEESFVVPVTGVVTVEVDVFGGDVVIVGGDEVIDPAVTPETELAEIAVVRRSSHGSGRSAEGEQSLMDIQLDVGLVADSQGKVLQVRSRTSHGEPWFQATDLHIKLPALGACTVRTARGHVYVTNNRDGVNIESSNGDVRVATGWPMRGPSSIIAEDGDIDWRVAAGSAGDYDMESVGGEVISQIRDGTWIVNDSRNDGDSMHAVLAGGGARVVLRTVDGSIRMFVGGRPHATGPMLADP